jgi:hypothetical protein
MFKSAVSTTRDNGFDQSVGRDCCAKYILEVGCWHGTEYIVVLQSEQIRLIAESFTKSSHLRWKFSKLGDLRTFIGIDG